MSCQLEPLLERIATAARPGAAIRGVQVRLQVDDDAPPVVAATASTLAQVVALVVADAVARTAAGWVRVRAVRADGGVRIEVADTGDELVGPPSRLLRRAADDLGVELALDGAPMAGSAVWFVVPAADAPPASLAA